MYLLIWQLGPVGRTIFPLWILDSAASDLPKIHTHLFSSSLKQHLWSSFWIFWKQQDACRFFWEVICDSTVSPNQGNNRYGSQRSQNTLPWHLFSWNSTLYPSVYLLSSETVRNHVFVNLGFGAWCNRQYFPPVKAGWLQAQTCQENRVSFFSSLKHQLWSIFEFSKQFSKEIGCLPLLAGNFLTLQFHLIKANKVW